MLFSLLINFFLLSSFRFLLLNKITVVCGVHSVSNLAILRIFKVFTIRLRQQLIRLPGLPLRALIDFIPTILDLKIVTGLQII